MKTLRQADLTVGAFLAILGIGTVIAATGIKGVAGETLDPRTLPTIVGWSLVALGLGIVTIGFRYNGDPIYLSWPSRAGVQRIVVTAFIFVLYLAALEPIGFAISTGAFVAVHIWYLGRYKWWQPVLGGIATGVVIDVVFTGILGLNLPLGLLELLY